MRFPGVYRVQTCLSQEIQLRVIFQEVILEKEKWMANQSRSGSMDDLSIAVLVFEGAEEQDVVGPYEMFTWMSLFQDLPPGRPVTESAFSYEFFDHRRANRSVFTVAASTDVYRGTSGMRIVERNRGSIVPGLTIAHISPP